MTDETKITVLPFVDPRKSSTRSAGQRNRHQKRLKDSREAKIDALMFAESNPEKDGVIEDMKEKHREIIQIEFPANCEFIADR